MSGIAGIWNFDGRPVSPSLLASLSETLSHRGPDGHGQWIDGSVGMACQLMRVTPESLAETQPAIGRSGTVLVFDGRLDNREELLARLEEAPVTAASPDPDLVLAAYDRFEDRVAEYLNGDFAFGLFDPNRRRLLLARDAIGIRPLYYTRAGRTVLFASEIKALLAHPGLTAQPHDRMLASLLFYSPPSDPALTSFREIMSLLPAHCATITSDGVSTRRYWDFAVASPLRLDSFPEYAEAFRHHFEQAVHRRVRSRQPVAVSLSGGLDSSAIFCLAETLHRVGSGRTPAPVGLSYLSPAGSASDEREFLLDIERQYGVSIRCVPVRLDDLIAGCRTAVWHLEVPFLDSQWPTLHTFHRRARELGVRVMLTGHWGDQVLFPQAYLVDLFRQLRWREIHAHLQAFERWMASVEPGFFRRVFWLDLVKRHLPARWIPYLRQLRRTRRPSWYTAPFRRLLWPPSSSSPTPASRLPTVHAQSLYDEARSFYHVQCMEWENKAAAMHGMDIAFPFLDRDLLSFLMRIPGDMQTWQGTPKALLREGLKDVLPERIVNRRWKADFTRLANAGLNMDFPRLVECLQDGSKAAAWGFLDRNALTAQLPHLKKNIRDSRTCETTWELTDLLGLELWLQVFFGTRPRVGGHAAATIEPGNMPAYRCKEAL